MNTRPVRGGRTAIDVLSAREDELDRALRRAFAGVEAPSPLRFGQIVHPAAKPAGTNRSRRILVGGAASVFLACAAMPVLASRWELMATALDVVLPWVARLAPVFSCLVWAWLERPTSAVGRAAG